VIQVAAALSPAVALLAPPLEAPLTTNTGREKKRKEMPQELSCRRQDFQTSDPVGVGAKEIEISQKTKCKRIEFPDGKLRTEGLPVR
jgi:hypothetical protein